MSFDTGLAQDFVRLTKESERLSEQLAAVEKERGVVHARLLKEFEKSGLQRLTVDGRTVYLRREVKAFKARGVETPQLVEALRAAGLGDYIKEGYSAQSLSSLYREYDKTGEKPPPELEGIVTMHESFDVRAVKA